MRPDQERRLRESIGVLAGEVRVRPRPGRGSPRIVCFAGHMTDLPGRAAARFPAEREEEVSRAIERRLGEARATIGYSAAARGSDLLFVEAMVRRGAEVNLVLPFPAAAFLETSVLESPSSSWRRRFESALARAASVVVTDAEPDVSDPMEYELCNLQMIELALQRARATHGVVLPLVVWDRGSPGGPGGTGAFVQRWVELGWRPAVIELQRPARP